MHAAKFLLRTASLIFHAICGGMAVVCLRYAVVLSDNPTPGIVNYLLQNVFLFGSLAVTVSYLKGKYLDA